VQTRATAARITQQVRTGTRHLRYDRGRYRHWDGCRLAPKVRRQLLTIQLIIGMKAKHHRMPDPLAPSLQHRTHQLPTRRRDEPVSLSPVRSGYGQRFFYDSSSLDDLPLPSDESWSVSDSSKSSDESWLSDYYNDDAEPYFEDFW